jgi:hypothetical protein
LSSAANIGYPKKSGGGQAPTLLVQERLITFLAPG